MTDASVNRRFAILAGGEGIARVLAFVATIWMARALGPSGYGVIGVALATLLYFHAIADAGLEVLGVREVAEDPDRIHTLVPALIGGRFLVALLTAVVVVVAGLTVMPQPEGAILAIYALALPLLGLNTRWVVLGLKRPAPASLSRICGEVLMAAIVLTAIHSIADLAVAPMAYVLGEAVGALVLAVALGRLVGPIAVRFSWRDAAPVLTRATPLVVHSLLGLVIFNADVVLLRIFTDRPTVGQYAAAYALISFAVNLSVAYGQSLLPSLTALNHQRPTQVELYHTSSLHVQALAWPLALGGWFLGRPLLELVFGPSYLPAGQIVAVLALSLPAALGRIVPQTLLIAHDRQRVLVGLTTASALLNVALNLWAIPRYGAVGAAGTTVLTEIVRTALVLAYVRRYDVRLPRWRRWLPLVTAVASLGLGWWWMQAWPLWMAIPAGAVIYVAVLSALGVLRWSGRTWPRLVL